MDVEGLRGREVKFEADRDEEVDRPLSREAELFVGVCSSS